MQINSKWISGSYENVRSMLNSLIRKPKSCSLFLFSDIIQEYIIIIVSSFTSSYVWQLQKSGRHKWLSCSTVNIVSLNPTKVFRHSTRSLCPIVEWTSSCCSETGNPSLMWMSTADPKPSYWEIRRLYQRTSHKMLHWSYLVNTWTFNRGTSPTHNTFVRGETYMTM